MSRVHDMGGRYGDGPIDPSEDDLPFARDWHRAALGLTLATGALGAWSIDASRRARESLPAADYNRLGYYEKWIAALADLLVERGLATRDDLVTVDLPQEPLSPRALRAEAVAGALSRGSPSLREGPAPRFADGARVRTRLPARNMWVPGGHTRLPDYAAGHAGRIVACRGCHVLPDTNAHFLGERPEPLYTVAFDAEALWGVAERPGDEVMLDLWESYLEPEP
ncbi:nitrile hydratase subunit beta [Roseivivax isoporae]|uniref:nitrile hydratase n=1 Tax=Roseivivax isoporae LMG 25204 TaxID=1449351 RepID=X7F5D5_9RHOB|nr:nitrile hydratase subunit beta [Roseivivax isoporae]ETX27311.1 nitrile hydratase [Roseivivax isoporae LMG 25204]